jgi:hypothetical protein
MTDYAHKPIADMTPAEAALALRCAKALRWAIRTASFDSSDDDASEREVAARISDLERRLYAFADDKDDANYIVQGRAGMENPYYLLRIGGFSSEDGININLIQLLPDAWPNRSPQGDPS